MDGLKKEFELITGFPINIIISLVTRVDNACDYKPIRACACCAAELIKIHNLDKLIRFWYLPHMKVSKETVLTSYESK